MPRRSDVVAEARKLLGTPYHHQGRVLGHGVDCYGVIEMVARSLGIDVPNGITYSRIPDELELIRNMDQYAIQVPVSEAGVGDIVLIPFLHKIRHMAILTDMGILHAYEPRGMVVEHAVDDRWRKQFRRAYRYPGVID